MKKTKNLISLLLCLLIAFIGLLPVNVYAYENVSYNQFMEEMGVIPLSDDTITIRANTSSSSQYFNGFGTFSNSWLQKNITEVNINASLYGDWNSDKLASFYFNLPLFMRKYKSFDCKVSFYDKSTSTPVLVDSKNYNVSFGSNSSDVSFTENGSTNLLLAFKEIELPYDVSNCIGLYITIKNIKYSGIILNSEKFSFGVTSTNSKQTSQQGFIKNVIEYLKDLLNSIKNLPSNILSIISGLGDRIENFFNSLKTDISSNFTNLTKSISGGLTNLKNSISGFFTNLTNSLRGWFENIGKWFTDLGNNIKLWFTNLTNNLKTWFDNVGKWFSDLWKNFSDMFNNIIDDVNNWWDGVVEWFQNLFIVPDGYMDEYLAKIQRWFEEHFGFLYQSITIIGTIINSFVIIFSGDGSGVISVPEIRLPWGNHIILHSTIFSFDDVINSNSQLKWVFGMIRTMSSAILLVTFFNFAKNKWNEILKDRSDDQE